MGWTAPRTFVTSEVETAAIFNAHLRDNLLAANAPPIRKTADESVTSSTVLQNDDHLSSAVVAGTYYVTVYLNGTSAANAAGHLGVAFTFPTASAAHFWGVGPATALASGHVGTIETIAFNAVTSGTLITSYGLSTSNNTIVLRLFFVFTASGTLQFQWAQSVSSVSASTLKTGSHMVLQQVA